MKVLGISAFYHDASAALVSDGKVVASAAEERFTLQKHDPNFPRFAVEACLAQAGVTAQELDGIVFYEEPHTKFTRVLSSTLSQFPFSMRGFIASMTMWMGSKLWIRDEISRKLDVHPQKVHTVPHHLSHAAQAFAASPFEEAAVLVVDAVGEWGSTSLFSARIKEGKLEIQPLESIPYPHSLELVYGAFTGFLGFKVNDGECNTMALATFGKPIYVEKVRKVIQAQSDGAYRIDPSFFKFDSLRGLPLTQKFIDLFGQPRFFKDPIPFDCLKSVAENRLAATPEQQRFADIAASVQLVLEETLLGLCRKLHRQTGLSTLCFAGGVALNCVANGKLLRTGPFQDIFIPPDPGDGGAAMGAALAGYSQLGGRFNGYRDLSPYLGRGYDEQPELEMLQFAKPEYWRRHRLIGTPMPENFRLDIRTYGDFEPLVSDIIGELRQGRIVGWFQGRFEHGPRALGNRSILTDPSDRCVAKRMSAHVKARAAFRPYALSMTEECASKILSLSGSLPCIARWMQMTSEVQASAADSVKAGIHSDGSTRHQVCSREENPRYHRLLSRFGEASGHAALLNTSFNPSGFPLASTPPEALLQFINTDMDVLVLNDTVLKKVR